MYSDVWTPNCVTIQDDSSNPVQYTTSCVGISATTADVDFIVERPEAAGGGFYGLAKFGTVTFTSTSDSQTDPDGDTHFGVWMTTTGTSSGAQCANPGAWVNEAFTVTW